MTELYSRRSFLAGVLTAGMLSTSAGYLLTRREPVTLSLATGADTTGARQLLIKMWNELDPRVTIVPTEVNSSTQDQYTKFLETRADIFNLDVIHIPRFAADKRIVPITPRNEISLLSPVRALCEERGTDRVWGVPFNTDVGMLYRRVTDKSADPEPTLKDAMAAPPGSFVGQLDTVGLQTDEAFVVNVLEQALAQDEAILDASGQISYGLGQWREALAPLAAAIRGKRVLTEAGEDDTSRTFQRSDLRFMRNWPVRFPAVDRVERAKPETAEIRIGRLPIGIIGGQCLAVSAESEHREEAEQVIHFLTDISAQKLLATFGFAPTGVDAYIAAELTPSIPQLNLIRQAVQASRPRPMHPRYHDFASRFADHTHRFLYDGEQLTQRFIADMQEALR